MKVLTSQAIYMEMIRIYAWMQTLGYSNIDIDFYLNECNASYRLHCWPLHHFDEAYVLIQRGTEN